MNSSTQNISLSFDINPKLSALVQLEPFIIFVATIYSSCHFVKVRIKPRVLDVCYCASIVLRRFLSVPGPDGDVRQASLSLPSSWVAGNGLLSCEPRTFGRFEAFGLSYGYRIFGLMYFPQTLLFFRLDH